MQEPLTLPLTGSIAWSGISLHRHRLGGRRNTILLSASASRDFSGALQRLVEFEAKICYGCPQNDHDRSMERRRPAAAAEH
jgi:hypothetical protein